MNRLYTIDESRAIEKAALENLPIGTLMQRAGQAAAKLAFAILPDNQKELHVLVLAGPGNNGGDALEMAAILSQRHIQVSVLSINSSKPKTEEYLLAKKRALSNPIQWEDITDINHGIEIILSRKWDMAVDGLFGIGLTKPITGDLYQLVKAINTLNCPVISLDIPSGLHADTGSVYGKTGIAIKATHTITFLGNKPGLYTYQGRDHAGIIHCNWLGVDQTSFLQPDRFLNHPSLFSGLLKKREHNTHKGSFGRLAVLGGEKGMTGAPVLASKTALYCGAGLVYTVFLDEPPQINDTQPELMYRFAPDFDFSSVVSVAGPGLGTSKNAQYFVEEILKGDKPLVLDADALNIIAEKTKLQLLIQKRNAPTILTPHPLEAARLLNTTTDQVQSDRLLAANKLAKHLRAVVILKGSGTIIADANGKTAVNPTGGPALATAGTGDVLSGIVGALLAQGYPAWETTLASVWMHGKAADELVKKGVGPIGLTAGELIPQIRKILNELVNKKEN